MNTHQSGYQARDHEVIDYHMCDLPGTPFSVRGPLPNFNMPYFVSLGAAQSFGCFANRPYPSILARELNLPCLNLGFGGVGPEFFLRNKALLDYINDSLFCIVQVMSGRSVSNSRCISLGSEYGYDRNDGKRKSTHKIFQAHLNRNFGFYSSRVGRKIDGLINKACLLSSVLERRDPLMSETRARWINDYMQLSYFLRVPTILFWFSTRQPDYSIRYLSVDSLLGAFPQLVNRKMLDRIRMYYGPYVECISSSGLPQHLVNRFTGGPAVCNRGNDRKEFAGTEFSVNHYYPSPEMHEEAAMAVLSIVKAWSDYLGVH